MESKKGLRLVNPVAAVEDVAKHAALGGEGLHWSEIPEDLEGAGLAAWEHLAKVFANDPARFREADRMALTCYCVAVEMEGLAADELRADGVVVQGRSNSDMNRRVRSPAWAQWRDASHQVRAWGDQLGLSPSSRNRMQISDAPAGDEDNPFAPTTS